MAVRSYVNEHRRSLVGASLPLLVALLALVGGLDAYLFVDDLVRYSLSVALLLGLLVVLVRAALR